MVICGGDGGIGFAMAGCIGGGVGVACSFVGVAVLLEVACGIGGCFGAGNHVVEVFASVVG
jgi:hypothetical protein